MNNKNFFITFLVLLLLFNSTIWSGKVNADFESIPPSFVYNTAWQIINDKFYFKSNVNLTRWKDRFENKINNLNDAHRYISKFIKSLNDPYTMYLTKEDFAEEQNIINSTLIGIGVKLANKKPIVLDVLSVSPASKEGIERNDYILSIDDKSTRNLPTSQIVNLIRGPKNTTLTIKLKRGNKVLVKTLMREEILIKSVSSELLDNDVALVKIDSFIPENTSKLFHDEILKIMAENGLIIDLRNNSGGLLKNAIEIADMFLSEGKIVTTVNNNTRANEFANSSQLVRTPVVILVNENTASASEIFTSALKENKRAIVIGKRTFGKGLVQEIVKLPDDSALHVTIATYLTPSGKNIHKLGVIPDETVFDEKKQVDRAKEILQIITNDKQNLKVASL